LLSFNDDKKTPCKTPCRYKVYDLRSYIHDLMHVILDDSAQIGATLTNEMAGLSSDIIGALGIDPST